MLLLPRLLRPSKKWIGIYPRLLQSRPVDTAGLEETPLDGTAELPRPSVTSKSLLKVLGKGSSFADYKMAKIVGGKGGDGAISFLKAPAQEIGPPSGGNGGRGGDVYVVACKNHQSLNLVQDTYKVENGGNGLGKTMHGSDGKHTVIKVPIGTVVRQIPDEPEWTDDWLPAEAHEELYVHNAEVQKLLPHFKFRKGYVPQEDRVAMLKERIPYRSKKKAPLIELDLVKDGQKHLIRRGGRGGFGNPHFKTPLIPGPGIASRGQRIGPMTLEFELKTLADAGLVGLPNAGKSTLLKAVSNAHPQIAPYPFTTLNPYVGTIDFADYWTMTIADMPGILPGAHQNLGLGLRFLRHIERNKVFVYVIDLAGKEPWTDLECLQQELEAYKPGLTSRPCLIAANKADVSTTAKANLETLKARTNLPIVPISAKLGKNITFFTSTLRALVEKL
ncbi:Mitochondrial ribosome-associated GTPase 2 [Kappamyces sp. JEL0829]|nr:Mitochondrial ribosome-associated GTPase 2 [Kappamyces sp. JEL0829]